MDLFLYIVNLYIDDLMFHIMLLVSVFNIEFQLYIQNMFITVNDFISCWLFYIHV